MCGRYTLTSAPQAIRSLFHYADQPNLPARYNIAPTQPIAIVRLVSGGREFALVRWGLLPSWVKDPREFSLLINARGETVIDKPAYRAAMKRRRCLIPADGFYEWRATTGRKQPYFIRAKSGAPLAFAGLWETWTGPNGEELDTAAIVTTSANSSLAPLHDRMPVIVPTEAFDLWLDSNNVDALTASTLIRPAPDDLLEAYPVSIAVNSVANDNPSLIDEIAPGDEPALESAPKKRASAAKPAKPKLENDDGQGVLF
jgi:putative SOS response-associated peptidase YedK